MKAKTILFCIMLPALLFSQNKKPKEIYFEGIVETEIMYDGTFYIRVKITKGELAGNTETLYYVVGFDDANAVECKGNAQIDGAGDSVGKTIKGTIIESTGNFEEYDEMGGVQPCYRPVEINWK